MEGNVKLLGETKGSARAGAVPVIAKEAVGALLSIFRLPVKVPARVGANFRVAVHVAPGARLAAQLLVWVKLASPDKEILWMTSELKPVLERLMTDVVVWPAGIVEKAIEFAESVRTGSVGAGTEPVTASA